MKWKNFPDLMNQFFRVNYNLSLKNILKTYKEV